MVGHERPGIDRAAPGDGIFGKLVDKSLSICRIDKEIAFIDSLVLSHGEERLVYQDERVGA